MASNSIPLQSLPALSASSTASTGNVQSISSPSSPAATSQSSAATANSPSTSSTSTTQVVSSASVNSTAAPNVPSQPLHVTLGRLILGNMNGLNVSGYILTVVGVVWAIRSYQVAALANIIAQEEVCRNHPSDPVVQAKAVCTQMRSSGDFDHQPLQRRQSRWTNLSDPFTIFQEYLSLRTTLMNDPAYFQVYYAWICTILVGIVLLRQPFLRWWNRTRRLNDGWVTVAVKLTSGYHRFSRIPIWLYTPGIDLEIMVIEQYYRSVAPSYSWPFGDSTYYYGGYTIVQIEAHVSTPKMNHHGGFDYGTRPNKRKQLSMRNLHKSNTGPLWRRRENFTAILVQQKRKTPIMKLLYALDVILLVSYYVRVSRIPDMFEGLGPLILPLSTMGFFIQYSVNRAFPIRPHLDGWRKLVYGGNCFILAAYILNYRLVPMGQKFVDAASCLVIQVAYRLFYYRSRTLEREAYLLLQAWLVMIALLHLIV